MPHFRAVALALSLVSPLRTPAIERISADLSTYARFGTTEVSPIPFISNDKDYCEQLRTNETVKKYAQVVKKLHELSPDAALYFETDDGLIESWVRKQIKMQLPSQSGALGAAVKSRIGSIVRLPSAPSTAVGADWRAIVNKCAYDLKDSELLVFFSSTNSELRDLLSAVGTEKTLGDRRLGTKCTGSGRQVDASGNVVAGNAQCDVDFKALNVIEDYPSSGAEEMARSGFYTHGRNNWPALFSLLFDGGEKVLQSTGQEVIKKGEAQIENLLQLKAAQTAAAKSRTADSAEREKAAARNAAATEQNDAPLVRNSADLTSWQATRDANATAVTALIAILKANPKLATAFSDCATHAGEMMLTAITQSTETIRRQSESKSQIQAWEDGLKMITRERLIFGEGACVWRVVAWTAGMTTFDPAQFKPNPQLGETGAALMLERIWGLECRTAGEVPGVFNARKVACATTLATKAAAAVRDPDLTNSAFDRLTRLLTTQPPQEFAEFFVSAVPEFEYSRLALADLLKMLALK